METTLERILRLLATFGTQGLVLLARTYLGPAALGKERHEETGAARRAGLAAGDVRLLGLALTKLAFEAGEIAFKNPDLSSERAMPDWKLDDQGHAPALSLAYVLAARRVWSKSAAPAVVETIAPRQTARARQLSTRNEYYAARSRSTYTARSPEVLRMSTYGHAPSRAPSPCGSCGGTHPTPPPAVPCYDPCAGGLVPAQRSTERCAGCGGYGGCSCGTAPARTYDRAQCPTLAISCETKQRLRECVKVAICEFARCTTDALCPGGRFDRAVFNDPRTRDALVDCFGQLVCSFLHCLPDALCPPEEECAPPPPIECIPCGYAVEVLR